MSDRQNSIWLDHEAAKRFGRGKRRVNLFREKTGMTCQEMADRMTVNLNYVFGLLCNKKAKATKTRQKQLDEVIHFFHLNPGWVYGQSKKIMIDDEMLTVAERYALKLDTTAKRVRCIHRFLEACGADHVDEFGIAVLGDVSVKTVKGWLAEKRLNQRFIKAMLNYCEEYGVNPDWLFTGKGEQLNFEMMGKAEAKKVDEPKPEPKTRPPKWWYVVNYTEVRPNGWVCVPDKYQIKQASSALEVMKDYPPEQVWVDGEVEPDAIIRTERAIGRYKTQMAAEQALIREKQRIERVGEDVCIAPWSYAVVK